MQPGPAQAASQPATLAIPGNLAQTPGASASTPLVIEVARVPEGKTLDPHWTAYAQAIGTPIVAVIAAAIAATIQYRQWKTAKAAAETARNKLKLDLFDRRFKVFNAVTELMSWVPLAEELDPKKIKSLTSQTVGSEFLFDAKVHQFITEELFMQVTYARSLHRRIDQAMQADNRQLVHDLSEELEKASFWFDRQLPTFIEMTGPFLQLSH